MITARRILVLVIFFEKKKIYIALERNIALENWGPSVQEKQWITKHSGVMKKRLIL